MTGTIIQIVVIVILIVLSALFSSAETALTTISPHKVRTLAEEGIKGAKTLEKVCSGSEKMLSTILICNNIVNLSASALMTIVVQNLFGSVAVGIGTGVLTLLVLIFGEIAPKTMATYRAEKLALKYAKVIYALMTVLTPIVFVINAMARGVLRLMGLKKDESRQPITESELRTIVKVSSEEGVIEDEEEDMINNVFDFSDTPCRSVMVPKINVVAIREDYSFRQIIDAGKDQHFTRLPVLDSNGENVVGIVNVKDMVFAMAEGEEVFKMADIIRPAEFTFEMKHLSDLFMEMKDKHCQMMIVLDEYGDFAGIVTMEDLIEELVGELHDESANSEIVKSGDGVYLIQGFVNLDDVNERTGTKLESEDYDSIGGLFMEKLGAVPKAGQSVSFGGVTLIALRVVNARIDLVKLVIEKKNND